MTYHVRNLMVGIAAILTPISGCSGAAPQSAAQAQAQDIDFIESHYIAKDKALTASSRQRAATLAAALKAKAGSLSEAQFILGVAEIVATADNGHSIIGYKAADAGIKSALPLRMAAFDDSGWLVLRAGPPASDLAGMVVTKVDGMPTARVMATMTKYIGGTTERRQILAMGLINAAGVLRAAGIPGAERSVHLTLRNAAGAIVERDVPFVPREQIPVAFWPSRWWSPAPLQSTHESGWKPAVSADSIPLYLRSPDQYFQIGQLPELNAVYLQMWSNEKDKAPTAFVARAKSVIGAIRPRNVILDLRFNKGGDLNLTADFMRSLPSAVPAEGHIFVITGRYTFSAGIVDAALVKKAGGDRVVLVGEQVGDRLRFWSEGEFECTPNSQICTRYTDGYFDLVDGCDGEPGCFRDNGRYDMKVGALNIDLPAPMTTAAYLAKRDPALDAITAYLGKH